jgi:hypothetical protein
MHALRTLAVTVLLVGTSVPGWAQATDPVPLSLLPSRNIPIQVAELAPALALSPADVAERAAELKRWTNDFIEWIEWSSEWTNRRERGWFTGSRDRRSKPPPPEWLPDECAVLMDDDELLSSACDLLAEWRNDEMGRPVRSGRVHAAAAAAAQEKTHKTIWWEHIHADLLWPAMQWQSNVYGVIGVHTATTVRGRFEVFLAPGAMLLNVPARNGTRIWKVAANYGIGYRLLDFVFPGGKPASLHVNLAKAWLLSDAADVVSGRTTDFVGLSISFRRTR